MEASSTPPAPRRARLGAFAIGAAAVTLVLAVAAGAFFLGRNSASEGVSTQASSEFDYATLNQIRELLGRNYVKPENLDDQTLFDAAINGMLSVLDDYGTYYVPPQDHQIDTIATGSFDGIGATVSQQNNEIVIVAPIKDTPAERAGLQAGDVILSVDGEDVTGWSVDRAVLRIRGPKGSQVTINIRHPDGKTQEYKLTREQVLVASVTTTPPSGALRDSSGVTASGIGYVHIREFSARTDGELQDAINEVLDAGAKGLIIDVRSNLGGLLDPTLKSIDFFLDSGVMIVQRDPNGREQTASARPLVQRQRRRGPGCGPAG
jgi:carboxyl-terminal processing protease